MTVLFREGWDAACRDLGEELPWITRRANLLVEGVPVPCVGARLIIGPVVLEVTQETRPCAVIERVHRGLRAVLVPDGRGGVCCRVLAEGRIAIGDEVRIAA